MITLASHIRYAVDPKAVTSSVFCFSKETNKQKNYVDFFNCSIVAPSFSLSFTCAAWFRSKIACVKVVDQ